MPGAGSRWAERKQARAAKRAENAQNELVTAAVFGTEAEARSAVGALEGQGLPAAIQLDQPAFGIKWVEAARVIVRRRDLEKAQQLLE